MTDRYVDSAATGTADGLSWINAKTTLGAAATAAAAGDRIFIRNTSAETSALANTITFPGTAGNPNLVISTDNTNQPPLASDYLAGASVTTTGNNAITLSGSAYIDGITFNSGSGANAPGMRLMSTGGTGIQYLKNCALVMQGTGGTQSLTLFNNGAGKLIWDNTTVQFGVTTDGINFAWSGGFEWLNTPSAVQGAAIPGTLIAGSTQTPAPFNLALIHGVDLSAVTGHIFGVNLGVPQNILANCKLNAGVTVLTGVIASNASYVTVVNCDSGATGYRNEWHGFYGDITTETTITLKNGASDGVQSVSHKYISSSNATPNSPLVWPPSPARFAVWNTTTGKSVTATVQIISSGTLNTNDIWLEIEYLGSATSPVSSFANNGLVNPLSVAAPQTASSASWNAQPATPVTQQLQVSFTPQMVGYVYGRIMVGKASTTVYVDPELTVK